MSDELQTDDEAIADAPPRMEMLSKATLTRGRKLGELTVRPMTAETFSYLHTYKNFFALSFLGQSVSPENANAIWGAAEFIYIHSEDADIVADVVRSPDDFRRGVRNLLNGPLNRITVLNEAFAIVKEMLLEYAAAESEVVEATGAKLRTPGKASARAGKRAT